ncbi:MAG: ATPase [Bacteroidales bacterium]|nr:ATPase [Bacteroidales bacterium]
MTIVSPLIIADSGSTKTDWAVISGDGDTFFFQTPGINPSLMDSYDIVSMLRDAYSAWDDFLDADVHFFGAGCIGGDANARVSKAVNTVLSAKSVTVRSDLDAACIALYGNKPGIACILGTGANSCHYDGCNIVANTHPLGFILGDEGSGAYIGKRLLADALKGILPSDLSSRLLQFTGLTYQQIISRVYREPFPNRFLASLTRFAAENIDREEIHNIILEAFVSFIDRNIMQYGAAVNSCTISAVGSVAFHFEFIFAEAVEVCGLRFGHVLQSPMDGLVDFFSKTNN